MTRECFRTFLLLLSLGAIFLAGSPILAGAPEGWFLAGDRPDAYKVGVDTEISATGDSSAFLRSIDKEFDGFGTLMQNIDPDEFRGKRVRLAGYVKTEDVQEWAGLWMRVDGRGRNSLAFDNMQDRSISGTTDWKSYDVVLDVPMEATRIAFGFLLSGTGESWVDGFSLSIVGEDVAVTAINPSRTTSSPVNLDFEER